MRRAVMHVYINLDSYQTQQIFLLMSIFFIHFSYMNMNVIITDVM